MKNANTYNQTATATAETVANILNVYRYKNEMKAYYSGARVNTIKFILNKEYKTVDMYLTVADSNTDGYSTLPFPIFGKLYDKEVKELVTFCCFNRIDKDIYHTKDESIYTYYFV